jgi:Major Facilitator Superfamily
VLTPSQQRHTVAACFLSWTLDAFDFFIMVFVLADIAKEFGTGITAVTIAITLTLAARPLGALLFGYMADRIGRRDVLIVNVLTFSVFEFLSGLAPSLAAFIIIRALFGVAMGGEWGVGASLTMESIPAKWRGAASGLLQAGYPCGYLLASLFLLGGVLGRRLAHALHDWRRAGTLYSRIPLLIREGIAGLAEAEAWAQSRHVARDRKQRLAGDLCHPHDDRHQFLCTWRARPLSERLSSRAAWFPGLYGFEDRHCIFNRGNHRLRRDCKPVAGDRTAPRDHRFRAAVDFGDPALGFFRRPDQSQSRCFPHDVFGAGLLRCRARTSQRTVAAGSTWDVSGLRLPVRKFAGCGYRNNPVTITALHWRSWRLSARSQSRGSSV